MEVPMETTATFSINEVGEETGKTYTGSFTVKTVLTRADRFNSDRRRREILGPDPDNAMPANQSDALMLGELFVRIVETDADWWKESRQGILLEDGAPIARLFELCISKQSEYRAKLREQSKEALEKLAQVQSSRKK
jgi:hypothetical protein